MRAILGLIAVLGIYSISLVFAGMLLEYGVQRKARDEIQLNGYVQEVMDCEQFRKNQQERDQLQGIDPHGKISGLSR